MACRSFQQIRRFHTEDGRQAVNNINAGIVDAAFQGTDVSAVNLRPVRKLFLRQPFGPSGSSQVPREYLSNFHEREFGELSSI